MSRRLRHLVTFAAMTAVCHTQLALSQGAAEPFALQPGDRVVFYGDSITEQRFYTWWTELYAVTHFPAQHIRFWNAGVGGDRVTGGSGGDIDKRLERDVFAHQPTVVTVMLGMNDGGYTPLTPAIEKTYTDGYDRILTSLTQRAPGAQILAIGPSPYDDVTRPAFFPGGYNSTLTRFGEIDRSLAKTHHAAYTDANAPFVAALKKAAAEDQLAAEMLVPDRVHPDLPAHLLIAMAVLRGWHAPAEVSRTVLDAQSTKTLTGTSRVRVSALSRKDGTLEWDSLEDGLPMPLGGSNASFEYVKHISGFAEEFNQESLLIRGLDPGTCDLAIDGVSVGRFTAAQLAKGINLAEMDTPMRRQSQSVEWTVRDKGDLQFVRTRILIGESSPEAAAALTKAEDHMQETIWHDAEPRLHHFALRAAATAH